MTGIYKITSPSNKVYIGQSVNIERRLKWHKANTIKTNCKLGNSFKKHGIDKHLFEVLCECYVDELNEKERYYQELYNAVGKNGLNLLLTKTNDKSGYVSIEVRNKLSEMRKGKKHSAERNLKNSLSKLGVKHSEERKEINRKAQLGRKTTEKAKYNQKIGGLRDNKRDEVRYACGKLILNIETGIFYLGLEPAADSANLARTTLSHKLIGRLKNDTSFIRV